MHPTNAGLCQRFRSARQIFASAAQFIMRFTREVAHVRHFAFSSLRFSRFADMSARVVTVGTQAMLRVSVVNVMAHLNEMVIVLQKNCRFYQLFRFIFGLSSTLYAIDFV